MREIEKFTAFKQHIKSIDNNKLIFSKFFHPLDYLFEELERQLGIKPWGPIKTVPFKSPEEVRALIKHPGNLDLNKFDYCFRCLAYCWSKGVDYPVISSAEKLIRTVKPLLDASKQYACADYNQFPTVANPTHQTLVKKRAAQGVATGRPQIPIGGIGMMNTLASSVWNAAHVKRAYTKVTQAKSGECTSFGYFAAHLLKQACEAGNLNPRIEVVSWDKVSMSAVTDKNPNFDASQPAGPENPRRVARTKKTIHAEEVVKKNMFGRKRSEFRVWHENKVVTWSKYTTHVFCVVNRTGPDWEEVQAGQPLRPMRQLPPWEQWGRDCWVVDPWLASLGYDSAWPVHLYPKPGMLKPVYQQMDSFNDGT